MLSVEISYLPHRLWLATLGGDSNFCTPLTCNAVLSSWTGLCLSLKWRCCLYEARRVCRRAHQSSVIRLSMSETATYGAGVDRRRTIGDGVDACHTKLVRPSSDSNGGGWTAMWSQLVVEHGGNDDSRVVPETIAPSRHSFCGGNHVRFGPRRDR